MITQNLEMDSYPSTKPVELLCFPHKDHLSNYIAQQVDEKDEPLVDCVAYFMLSKVILKTYLSVDLLC